jgi:hypothetical protein
VTVVAFDALLEALLTFLQLTDARSALVAVLPCDQHHPLLPAAPRAEGSRCLGGLPFRWLCARGAVALFRSCG